MDFNKLTPIVNKPNGWALMPLVVFLCLYLVTSLIVNDFYKVPITVAFLVASIYNNPTDLIKENMLCNNYIIVAKH